jgi:hypothetical protein
VQKRPAAWSVLILEAVAPMPLHPILIAQAVVQSAAVRTSPLQ